MSAIKDDLRNIKDDAKDKLSGDIEDLKTSFGKLRSDVMNLLSDTVGVGKTSGKAVKNQVKTHAVEAVGDLKDHLHDWQDRGGESLDALGQKISENPVTAAMIAIGVGFLLAKMFSHKK